MKTKATESWLPKSHLSLTGFTLIELIIVAAIIMVLVAVSTPLFRRTFKDLELKDTAYNISKIIKYAQQKAIIEEKKYRLLFDFDKKAYWLLVWEEKGEAASDWKKVKGRFGEYFYLPDDVRFKGDKEKITFLPNGRCDKISLYILDKENNSFIITTNGSAGYVKVFEVKINE